MAVEGMVGSGKAKEEDPACWKDMSKCTWFMYLIIAQGQVATTTLKRTLVLDLQHIGPETKVFA